MSLLVESLHMRTDGEMVIGAQELASGSMRRGSSFILSWSDPCGVLPLFLHYDHVHSVSLLVESLHMRTDGEMVIGAQELASGSMRRGSSFILSCDFLYNLVIQNFASTYLDQALLIYIVCLCVLYPHSKDTSPAPSKL